MVTSLPCASHRWRYGAVKQFSAVLAMVAVAALAAVPEARGTQQTQSTLGLGVDVSNFDPSVRPQDDFFQYVNGAWLARTQIPEDRSTYGAGSQLAEITQVQLRAIIEHAARTPNEASGSDVQKIGDFYLSFMDTTQIEALGLAPLKGELDRIAAIESPSDVVRYMGYSRRLERPLATSGVLSPITLSVSQDGKNAATYITYVSQSGLGLPDRDYYFNEQERFQEIREEYVAYIEHLLALAGDERAREAADDIMAVETRLARSHWTRVKDRDRDATYNKFTLASADTLTPGFSWRLFLDAAGVGQVEEIVMRQPDFFAALAVAVQEEPVERWRSYFRWKLVNRWAQFLGKDFVDAHFALYYNTISGTAQNRPRWKRAVAAADETMGELLGKMYVEQHFKPEAKARMDRMVENLRRAFEIAIYELEWMTDETKAAAQAKLAKFNTKIGYPDTWKDYSRLEIRRDDLIGNLMRAGEVAYDRMISRLGKPVDRGEWLMTPQTVNAYYSPTMNEIVFPAAILQPPFFNVAADDAVNYGAIGAVIGHEFSHGFDDQGRKSDGYGNLRDWWTERDQQEFKRRARGLVEQYAAYSPLEGMHLNGELTLGENIGDLAGLTMAYRAYRLSLNGEEPPEIDGFAGEQRFFLGYAQVWRGKYRDDELRRRLVIDPHSPAMYRANGVLSNMPEFYRAFDVKEGDDMYRPLADRVKIW